ncbi:hypothetical protein [Falsirhodobacter xinxiangensis]|uniref:hypothetical protein n=1 Tax=Falsirhodobacter xinxiangensis TaxID=2530049 RepID=UPI0010AAD5DE|nr:hypothetical protein [Rhodobacter xinxiangensis]
MTKAILKLDGSDHIEGQAEAGGDYVRLLVDGLTSAGDLKTASRGAIDIEGMTSDVVLENVSPSPDGQGTILTMRLFKPIG